jgi:hypothetical protein
MNTNTTTEYSITILFSTPEPLSASQLWDLVGSATTQINEPEETYDNKDNEITPVTLDVRATFGEVS